MRTTSDLIVDTLTRHGVSRVFCVPGESYLGLLDALHDRDDVDTVVCRHESGAGFMALADARLTGAPGVALVSRGPGAANAAIAVHTAQQDGVPFLLIVGQVPRDHLRRDAFQEIDYGRMFGGMAKWTAEVSDPARMAETLLRACHVATSGLPGPVVIAVPEDVLTASCDTAPSAPQPAPRSAPHPDDTARLRDWLGAAHRPLLLAGSGIERTPGGREALHAFAEAWQLPVLVSFRRHDLFSNRHPLYAGDMGLAIPASQLALLQEADFLLVAGARLSDITTQGYRFPAAVRPEMRLVHVHADPAVIGTHFPADLGIACDPATLLRILEDPPGIPLERATWINRVASERERISRTRTFEVHDGIAFEEVVARLGASLAPDAIVTVDAGNFGAPVYRVVPFEPPQRLLAPIAGAMGFGVPAAVAAALRCPSRQVVCLVGDGGFLMTGSELAVALERRLPLKVIVSENRVYGSIRIHQEREYPGRTTGTGFANPDLMAMGRAYGFNATHLRRRADLERLPELLASPGPEFVVVDTSLEAVLPARNPPRVAD